MEAKKIQLHLLSLVSWTGSVREKGKEKRNNRTEPGEFGK